MLQGLVAVMPKHESDADTNSVPPGWSTRSLAEIARYRNGINMQRFPPTGDAFLPVLKIAQLRDGSLIGADRVTDELPEDVIVRDGDVVFSWSGSLMVRIWSGGTAALNQHLFKVTSSSFPRWFYYFWTRAHLPDFQSIAADKKTTMGHIKRQHLADASVLVPDAAYIEEANRHLEPLLERSIQAALQAGRLEQLRDHILRALLSGQVRLNADANHLLETVL